MKISNFIKEALKDLLSDAWIYVVTISIIIITLLIFNIGI